MFICKYVLLIGGFNARTHNKHDFMDEDKTNFCRQFDNDKKMIIIFRNMFDLYNLLNVCIYKDKIVKMKGTKCTWKLTLYSIGYF